jgi:hypothetical protein
MSWSEYDCDSKTNVVDLRVRILINGFRKFEKYQGIKQYGTMILDLFHVQRVGDSFAINYYDFFAQKGLIRKNR